ncbi:acetyl-CoA carboxylase biotin carboxylase subunit [Komagataeibacter nataicola]|uniref:Biotin carboxylase n=1 Tax=Komagataeibacter nataicola TaxID=265960 RepID=A0A9N7H1Q4_9PROT|nr:acetyl-CoA carboxylase biotin carboxylase subunit [Komagataeibacter nataicola]AQU88424.1 acetyl-CoA carboxylase biotin carboxylase subunit [Komagataeibacter nataicola]PYD67121.1 acetyl-CoA carboxylase biotin carboxylase subunit [Komagataeibacter nataicola]WEQ54475.1 acetyl-CoA carboxylase biotin carboxylase subunit [Komagataeibacter nataicola]WNM08854.1 acetyl-CoA carboxylase biotin carboxylase subunit [Komagataeibacter nataicola]GBR17486.1 acetyl-CoA carboxylase biotin carboxylase subunit 
MRKVETVLIANRGEIALRVLRACRELGLRTVGIYSEADASLRHLSLCDRTICIGPAPAAKSYLDTELVLRAARLTQADAIHPGYGFLSENPTFARAVEEAGLVLIGPSSTIMRRMGDKIEAKRMMLAAGMPCLPGSDGPLPEDMDQASALGARIGYPLIVKAAGGGGGRGMRIVHTPADLRQAVQTAREEAIRAFGNGTLYGERFLTHPRHVEIQVMADQHGHAVWLGDRDCSVQRRHQKVIEEAPAYGIGRDEIARLGALCAATCLKIGYVGAGTFEFLYEDGAFYFIEMNTRIQVEHPVTEMVTGIDIVREQIRVAMGEPLSLTQADVRCDGHAIECRINAENPDTFMPGPGKVTRWLAPGGEGVRTDTHLYDGYVVPTHYDSLVAKLIVRGRSRNEAISKMRAALEETEVDGIPTTIPLHLHLMEDERFRAGDISVHYLEERDFSRNKKDSTHGAG